MGNQALGDAGTNPDAGRTVMPLIIAAIVILFLGVSDVTAAACRGDSAFLEWTGYGLMVVACGAAIVGCFVMGRR